MTPEQSLERYLAARARSRVLSAVVELALAALVWALTTWWLGIVAGLLTVALIGLRGWPERDAERAQASLLLDPWSEQAHNHYRAMRRWCLELSTATEFVLAGLAGLGLWWLGLAVVVLMVVLGWIRGRFERVAELSAMRSLRRAQFLAAVGQALPDVERQELAHQVEMGDVTDTHPAVAQYRLQARQLRTAVEDEARNSR